MGTGSAEAAPFAAGAMVVVTLHSPKEKFWGTLLELSVAGVSVCGADLNAFDEFVALVKAGEASPSLVFFPMHRVERIELDARNGVIPSLAEQFAEKTGHDARSMLTPPSSRRQP